MARPARALCLALGSLALVWLSGLLLPTRRAAGATSDAERQLAFVDRSLDEGEAARMQALFPEGYLFHWALSGLAHAELGQQGSDHEGHAHLARALLALQALDSPQGRAPFSPSLEPPYGIFYLGWTTRLRGAVALLGDRDPARITALQSGCEQIAAAVEASPSPFLPSYPGQSWPVDTVVAMSALATCDRVLQPRYRPLIERWTARARALLDPRTGLLPHRTDPESGATLDGARGTSQTMMLVFLPEIDPVFAAEQYAAFEERFVTTRLGLYGVLEYPPERRRAAEQAGEALSGDVDSGPLVLGLSLSASAVAIGAAAANGDGELADRLVHAAELAGVQLGIREKRALFGALPVADAFLAWAKSIPVR